MRLLYVTDRLSDRGGADHHLSQVMTASVEAGHRVSVAYGRVEGSSPAPRGIEHHRIRGLSDRVESDSRLEELGVLLDRADVIHVQNIMNPTAIRMAVAVGRAVVTIQDHRMFCPGGGKTMPDGSVCATEMGDDPCRVCLPDGAYRGSILELTRRRLAAVRGAEIVALSGYMADELAAVGVEAVTVIPPWVEIGPAKTDPGEGFMLAGRLVSHKGVVEGWRAWRTAGSPSKLTVAGSGPLESELHGAETLGWLPKAKLDAELRRARALIFTAWWQEPFGILGVEALAQGTPVIVADVGGTVDWSMTGCVRVPAGDPDAMASAIGRLAADPDLAMKLGAAGRNLVRERFSRDAIAPGLFELYSRAAAP